MLDNRLRGNTGDNTLSGQGGDDLLEGGSGVDTAVYLGPRDEYELAPAADGALRVRDGVPGRDGSDEFGGLELLRFSDGLVEVQ